MNANKSTYMHMQCKKNKDTGTQADEHTLSEPTGFINKLRVDPALSIWPGF